MDSKSVRIMILCLLNILQNAGTSVTLLVENRAEEYNRFEAKIQDLKQHVLSGSLPRTPKTPQHPRALNESERT